MRSVDDAGVESVRRFRVPPTVRGLQEFAKVIAQLPHPMVVAEPTSLTWLGLSATVNDAGGQFVLIGARHSARLRGAIMGKNKSDVIDADVLSRAPEVFDLHPFDATLPAALAVLHRWPNLRALAASKTKPPGAEHARKDDPNPNPPPNAESAPPPSKAGNEPSTNSPSRTPTESPPPNKERLKLTQIG